MAWVAPFVNKKIVEDNHGNDCVNFFELNPKGGHVNTGGRLAGVLFP